MKVVLDTNVLVSGLWTPKGPAGRILQSLAAGAFDLYLDERIFAEYRDVFARKKIKRKVGDGAIANLLRTVTDRGRWVSAPRVDDQLPDPKDQMFLEVAVACQADYLVTFNLKHFPRDQTLGIPIILPHQFLALPDP